MKYQELINTIFKQETIINKIDKGLTNDIYITNVNNIKYIIRIPKDDIDNIININHEKEVLKLIRNTNLDVKEYYYNPNNRIRITYYIDNAIEYKDNNNINKIIVVAKLLKELHSIDVSNLNVYFNPIDMYIKYTNNINKYLYNIDKYLFIIDIIKSFKFNYVLCHNDLVSGNLLFSKDKDYLIDYEYAGLNDPLFDVMSFLTENEITNEYERNLFYKEYFNDLTEDLKYKLNCYECFTNLLWYTWANMMYDTRNDDTYKLIAKDKYNALIMFDINNIK